MSYQVTNKATLQEFESDCPQIPAISTLKVVGATTPIRTDEVFACLLIAGPNLNTGAGVTSSFMIKSPENVPEFPLGLLLVIAVPALLLLKRHHVVSTGSG